MTEHHHWIWPDYVAAAILLLSLLLGLAWATWGAAR